MLANPLSTRESAPFLPDRKSYGTVPEDHPAPSLVVYGVVIDDADTATLTRKARRAFAVPASKPADSDSYCSAPARYAAGKRPSRCD
jgi:hypothetical protein